MQVMQHLQQRKMHPSPKLAAPTKAKGLEALAREQGTPEKGAPGAPVPVGPNAHVIDPHVAGKQNFQDLIQINSFDAAQTKRHRQSSNAPCEAEYAVPALRVYDEASLEYANILKTIRNGNKRKEYTTTTACLDEMLDCNYLNLAHVSVALVVLIRAGAD